MRYIIEKADNLYCVYRWDKIGYRIIAAYERITDNGIYASKRGLW